MGIIGGGGEIFVSSSRGELVTVLGVNHDSMEKYFVADRMGDVGDVLGQGKALLFLLDLEFAGMGERGVERELQVGDELVSVHWAA